MTVLYIVLAIILISVFWWVKTANRFRRWENKIREAASGIEIALVNRFDMLTKLKDVAAGYAGHEKTVFAEVIELRRGMSLGELSDASRKMDALQSGIHLTAEAYPELRSSETFKELQSGIRDAEAHLQAARRLYNSQVTAFNTALEVFPSSLVGHAQKLTRQELFAADAAKTGDVSMQF